MRSCWPTGPHRGPAAPAAVALANKVPEADWEDCSRSGIGHSQAVLQSGPKPRSLTRKREVNTPPSLGVRVIVLHRPLGPSFISFMTMSVFDLSEQLALIPGGGCAVLPCRLLSFMAPALVLQGAARAHRA